MKRYAIRHVESDWEAVVTVAPGGEKTAQEANEFYSSNEYRLAANGNDHVKAFLQLVGPALFAAASSRRQIDGLVEQVAKIEGFPRLDGSSGITLVDCATHEVGAVDFRVTEI